MNVSISIDLGGVKDKTVVLAHSGVTRARKLADASAARARGLSEIGKLKVRNSIEQEAIRRAYSDLGRLYYAERGSAPEPSYAELCQKITDALARVSRNNERIADIRAAGQSKGAEDAETGESCCCGSKEPAAEAETPCCCGDPPAEDDKPEE